MEWGILFMGPVGAGKTQAIDAISDIEVVNTDVRATDATKRIKSHTTVAMDVGVLNLQGGDKLRLYGAPGQDRFDFMWDILLEQCRGIVLLLNHADPQATTQLDHYLRAIALRVPQVDMPLVVGITHVDLNPGAPTDVYRARLRQHRVLAGGVEPPVFSVDVRLRDHVRCLLMVMVAQLEMAGRFPAVSVSA